MGFSPLAHMGRRINPCPQRSQGMAPGTCRQSPRNAPITGVLVHYNYGVDAYGEATNPNRVVSANYWIANDGTLIPNIDENYRPWTSGAAGYPNGALADRHSITVEVSNAPGFKTSTPMGAISPAAYKTLVALIGDVFKRYNLGPVKRTKSPTGIGVKGHNDFVSTSCPGPWIAARWDQIISDSEKYRTGGTPTKKAGFLMALTDKQQDEIYRAVTTGGKRIRDIKDLVTGGGPYGKKASLIRDILGAVTDSKGVGAGARAQNIQDYISGGGPKGNDPSLLREILAGQKEILARLDKLEE